VLEIGNMSETIRHIGKYVYAFKELRLDQQKKQEICFQPLCEFYACPDQMLTLNGCETCFMDISDLPHEWNVTKFLSVILICGNMRHFTAETL
jgi:hypothetical protein